MRHIALEERENDIYIYGWVVAEHRAAGGRRLTGGDGVNEGEEAAMT